MSLNKSVFEMVHEVLGEAKQKLAAEAAFGTEKVAAQQLPAAVRTADTLSTQYLSKLSQACFHLADNLHQVIDSRSPQEKLAEYAEIHKRLTKRAFSVGNEAPAEPSKPSSAGDEGKGEHQTQEGDSDSISPTSVTTNDSGTGVGGSTAIPSMPTMTTGGAPDVGDLGEGTAAHQSPKSVTPNEAPYPTSPANALETNKDMMMPSQPEEVLKQARAERMLDKVSGKADRAAKQKLANTRRRAILMKKAAMSGIPLNIAASMVGLATKTAEDALYPAQISAGSQPELQSEPGIPSQLSQGSEAGSNTPRETAPNSGEGGGRDLLSSVESVINATKQEAKRQNKGALAELLTEPAMSEQTDKALNVSLDNTSSAGVKISAAREMLRKFAKASPTNAQKLALLLNKLAEGEAIPQGAAPEAAPAAVPPEMPPVEPPAEALPQEGGVMEPGAPSEAALQAAAAGVTPEELAIAEAMLSAGEGGAGEMEGAPMAGVGDTEKTEEFGGGAGGFSPATSSAPQPGL